MSYKICQFFVLFGKQVCKYADIGVTLFANLNAYTHGRKMAKRLNFWPIIPF